MIFFSCDNSFSGSKEEKLSTVVIVDTSKGVFEIELFDQLTPETVKNFLYYVDQHRYDSLIFHRVIDNFVIQGGGLNLAMAAVPCEKPIKNEAARALPNDRGSVAMARTTDIHSATNQFFINLRDNSFLNYQNDSEEGFGYCVFGKVIKGMNVVDAIGAVLTTTKQGYSDVPLEPVFILSIKRKDVTPH